MIPLSNPDGNTLVLASIVNDMMANNGRIPPERRLEQMVGLGFVCTVQVFLSEPAFLPGTQGFVKHSLLCQHLGQSY
jgi:hypothetical protein